MIIDIASIVFVCVTANHLGLVGAIERIIGLPLPIVNCPKCLTWWSVTIYGLFVGDMNFGNMLAISFFASYMAIWLELFEGYIDTLYLKVYEKITATNSHDTASANTDCGSTKSAVSKL